MEYKIRVILGVLVCLATIILVYLLYLDYCNKLAIAKNNEIRGDIIRFFRGYKDRNLNNSLNNGLNNNMYLYKEIQDFMDSRGMTKTEFDRHVYSLLMDYIY